MILSDIELQPQEDIILLEDNGPTATEGRAFGHVIMTIDGQEVDVYFGVTDSSTGMVSQLEAIVKANAEASGRQFIVSGYPAENPCRSAVSSGSSLAVGALGDVSAADALEARARTRDDSAGIALRSDKYTAMIIVIK